LKQRSQTHGQPGRVAFQPRTPQVDQTTIVTAYYVIDSKHPPSKYAVWLQALMQTSTPMIIYTDRHLVPWLLQLRQHALNSTVVVALELHELMMEKLGAGRRLWHHQEWLDDQVPFLFKRLLKGLLPLPVHGWLARLGLPLMKHTGSLYAIWNEKPELLHLAAKMDPFGSRLYFWVDAGCLRPPDSTEFWGPRIGRQPLVPEPVAAGLVRLLKQRVMLLEIPFSVPDLAQRPLPPVPNRATFIGGTVFGGSAVGLKQFRHSYYHAISRILSRGGYFGTDQLVLSQTVLDDPSHTFVVRLPPAASRGRWLVRMATGEAIDSWHYLLAIMHGSVAAFDFIQLRAGTPNAVQRAHLLQPLAAKRHPAHARNATSEMQAES